MKREEPTDHRKLAQFSPRLQESAGRRFIATVDERRESTRFEREPATDFAVVWQKSGEEILAEVHDESLTGLGLLLEDTGGLQMGTEVDVAYAGDLLVGEVRHIEAWPDGGFLVGLRCERLLPKKL